MYMSNAYVQFRIFQLANWIAYRVVQVWVNPRILSSSSYVFPDFKVFILQSRLLIWSHLILCFWLGENSAAAAFAVNYQGSFSIVISVHCAIALSFWPSALPSGNFVYSHHHPYAFSDILYSTFYNLRSALRALWIWVHEGFILKRFLNSALLSSDIFSLNFGAYCSPDLFTFRSSSWSLRICLWSKSFGVINTASQELGSALWEEFNFSRHLSYKFQFDQYYPRSNVLGLFVDRVSYTPKN